MEEVTRSPVHRTSPSLAGVWALVLTVLAGCNQAARTPGSTGGHGVVVEDSGRIVLQGTDRDPPLLVFRDRKTGIDRLRLGLWKDGTSGFQILDASGGTALIAYCRADGRTELACITGFGVGQFLMEMSPDGSGELVFKTYDGKRLLAVVLGDDRLTIRNSSDKVLLEVEIEK